MKSFLIFLQESIQRYGDRALWIFLLVAITANLTYLLWPTPPQTLIIYPHPATLQAHSQNDSVLVETTSPSSEAKSYEIVSNPMSTPEKLDIPSPVNTSKSRSSHFPSKKAFTGTLNLNTATAQQLQLLPGIGEKMAERIIDYRKAHNGFQSLNQLLEVSGIGAKKFAKLAPHCKI